MAMERTTLNHETILGIWCTIIHFTRNSITHGRITDELGAWCKKALRNWINWWHQVQLILFLLTWSFQRYQPQYKITRFCVNMYRLFPLSCTPKKCNRLMTLAVQGRTRETRNEMDKCSECAVEGYRFCR